MSAQRVEIQHHTLEQVGEHVRTTRDLLDVELGVGNWDGATFAAVVGLVASKSIHEVQPRSLAYEALIPALDNVPRIR